MDLRLVELAVPSNPLFYTLIDNNDNILSKSLFHCSCYIKSYSIDCDIVD